MEENRGLFTLQIEPVTRSFLNDIARWAKFLSITGMAGILLMILSGVGYSIWIRSVYSNLDTRAMPPMGFVNLIGISSVAGAVILGVVSFIPFFFLYRFSVHLRKALDASDQISLNRGFGQLKVFFRYIGVLLLIGILFMAMWIVLFGIAAAF